MSDDKVRRELRDVLRPHVGAHSDIVANAILASGLLDQIRAEAGAAALRDTASAAAATGSVKIEKWLRARADVVEAEVSR